MGKKAAVTPDWSQGLGAGRGPSGQSCTAAKDKGGSDLRLCSTFSHRRQPGKKPRYLIPWLRVPPTAVLFE